MALRFKCANCEADIIVEYVKMGETAVCPHCKRHTHVPSTATETTERGSMLKERSGSVDSMTRTTATQRAGKSWSGVHAWASWLSICGVLGLLGFAAMGIVNLMSGNISQGVLDLVLAIPILVAFNGFAQLLEVFVEIELNTRETRDALCERRP
jgi:hypothetical protein